MEPESSPIRVDPEKFIRQLDKLSGEIERSRDVIAYGHKFVYINDESKLRLFSSEAEASRAGFNTQLGLDSIMRMSEQLTPRLNYQSQHRLAKAITTLSQRNITNKTNAFAEKSPVTSFFSRIVSTLKPSTEIENQTVSFAKSIDPATTSSIAPSVMDRLHDFLPLAETAIRSNGGMMGVIFVGGNGNCEVFKLAGNSGNSICADRLLTGMGFNTPREGAISSEHPLGVMIRSTISNKLPPAVDPRFAESIGLALIPQVRRQLAKLDEQPALITHMNMIQGTSFGSVPLLQAEQILQNREALNEIGRMIFLDAFMGNDDRIGLEFNKDNVAICSSFNLDNFMLNIEADRVENGYFSLIDSDFKLDQYTFPFAQDRVSTLLDPAESLDRFFDGMLTKMQHIRSEDLLLRARTELRISSGIDADEAIATARDPLEAEQEAIAQAIAQEGFRLRELPENWSDFSPEEKAAFKAESKQLFKAAILEGVQVSARLVAQLDDALINQLVKVPGMEVDIDAGCVMQLRNHVRDLLASMNE